MSTKKNSIRGIKGMEDILPEDAAYFQFIEQTAREIFHDYGYREIRTPILESSDLFQRTVGDSSDIVVSKQMYTFMDPGDRSNTMRPEGTAGVVRSVVEHGLLKENPTCKLWYTGPMFRYEKPQKGRLRQFHQLGIEAFGYPHPASDAEIIVICHRILSKLGFRNVSVRVNNLGDKTDRALYNAKLRATITETIQDQPWCEQCKIRAQVNPMRVFDCKETACKELVKTLPRINEFINADAHQHFKTVTDILTACNISWTLDEDIVRGLDYYCRTVFELVQEGTGSQSAVGGGGRYDGLVAELGGPESCGVGVGLGIERLILAMKAQSIMPPDTNAIKLHFIALDEASLQQTAVLLETVRQNGITCTFDLQPKGLKAGLKSANKSNAQYAVILGSNELEQNVILLKNLQNGEQIHIPFDTALAKLCSL